MISNVAHDDSSDFQLIQLIHWRVGLSRNRVRFQEGAVEPINGCV